MSDRLGKAACAAGAVAYVAGRLDAARWARFGLRHEARMFRVRLLVAQGRYDECWPVIDEGYRDAADMSRLWPRRRRRRP